MLELVVEMRGMKSEYEGKLRANNYYFAYNAVVHIQMFISNAEMPIPPASSPSASTQFPFPHPTVPSPPLSHCLLPPATPPALNPANCPRMSCIRLIGMLMNCLQGGRVRFTGYSPFITAFSVFLQSCLVDLANFRYETVFYLAPFNLP